MARLLAPVLRLYFKDRWIRVTLGLTLGLVVVGFVAVVWGLPKSDSLPLHYNIFFGIDYLGSWQEAVRVPLAGLVIAICNAIVGVFLWRRDRVISYFLGFATVAVNLVLATAIFFIVYLNH